MPIQASASADQFGFWDAAHQGDMRRLRQMIDGGCDVNGTCPAWKSAYQPTALAYAVWGNQLEAIKLLLDAGADPDRVDGVCCAALLHSSCSARGAVQMMLSVPLSPSLAS